MHTGHQFHKESYFSHEIFASLNNYEIDTNTFQ